MGRHTRRTVHPQPHYSPTPATAHSRPQTRNGAHTSKKIDADNAKISPRIRRRTLYAGTRSRNAPPGESATAPSTQLGALGRAVV